jgi:glycosyltransferase involved in cell wall biosynthesis
MALDFGAFKDRYQKVPVEEYPNDVKEAVPDPMVSVRVSTYQHADFIRDCLDGVLMQETDFPVEILVGEDESDDGTREICKDYADRHPGKIRLFLHRRENNIKIHGRPTGRFQVTYTGFQSRGKYIALCEGDDYWTDPKKLQKQVDFLEENEEFVLAYQPSVNMAVGEAQGAVGEHSTDDIIDYPKLLTFLYENKIREMPESFFQIINGDTFLLLRLKTMGKIKCITMLRPAVRRIHNGGMWSTATRRQRAVEGFDSCLRIFDCMEDTKSESDAKRELYQKFYSVLITSSLQNEISSEVNRIADHFRALYQRGLGGEALAYTMRRLREAFRNKSLRETARSFLERISHDTFQ